MKRIIKLPAVKQKSGKGKTEIYDGMKDGSFPQSVSIGKRAVGWIEEEIDSWIESCIAARDGSR